MQQPPPTPGPSPDLDTLLERVRATVKARSSADIENTSKGDGRETTEQLATAMQEQASINQSILDAVTDLAEGLHDLREQMSSHARTAEQGDALEKRAPVQSELDHLTESSEELLQSVDAVTARLFALEPRLDAEVAKVRIGLREAISATSAKLHEELHSFVEHADGRARELGTAIETAVHDNNGLMERKLTQLSEQVNARLDTIESGLEQSAAATRREAQELRQAIAEAQEKAGGAAQSHELTGAIDASANNLREQLSPIHEELQQLQVAAEQIAALNARLTQIEPSVLSATTACDDTASQLATLAPKLEDALAELSHRIDHFASEKQAEAEVLEARTTAFEQRVHQLQGEIEGAVTPANNKVASLEHNVVELTQQLQAEVGRGSNAAQELQAAFARLEESVPGFSNTLEEVRAQQHKLAEHLEVLTAGQSEAATANEALKADRVSFEGLQAELATLQQQVASLGSANESQSALQADYNRVSDSIARELDALKLRLLRLENVPRAVIKGEASITERTEQDPDRGATALSCDIAAEHFDYFNFEQRWRGSVEEIRERQRQYVDLFRGRKNVLDMGCGRGEFVELMEEHDIKVQGIDSNPDMVHFCREKNLPVVQADIFAYLTRRRDQSFDGITAFQVVEHLAPEHIISLVELCAQKLAPGGLFLAETVNPNCPLALGNFFLDPTHVRPVPAATLAFICQQHGLHLKFIRYSAPVAGSEAPRSVDVTGEALADVSVYQDYALVAEKRDRTRPATAGRRKKK